MAKTIDERVVEMKFDNSNFESNVKQTMSTLDKLKEKLNLPGSSKGLDDINEAAKNNKLSALGEAVDTVKSRFSVLETIAVGGLLRIGSQAVDAGEKLIKSLTFDQVAAGFDKYEQKTQAVQTILAATGKPIEEVNQQLEKLIWFADETSYSFVDMTSNIGKFTSQGIELDTAVTAMEGISTWAALSGQTTQEAARAMYNLSQAIGVGAVKLQDWKSIENANMATETFKKTVLEAATATGVLAKKGEGDVARYFKVVNGKVTDTEVSVANFSSTLKDGWFSSQVLLDTLDQFGGYADGIHEVYETLNSVGGSSYKTTSQIISDMKALKGASDDTILGKGYTADLIPLVRKLAEESEGLGAKAFEASQQALTFTQAIDSVKDAVSSQWMITFEHLFGDFNTAKKLWTDLSNDLYDVFVTSHDNANQILKYLDVNGTLERLRESVYSVFTSIIHIVGQVKEAFRDIFPEKSKESINLMVNKFALFLKNISLTENVIKELNKEVEGHVVLLTDLDKKQLSSLDKMKLGFSGLFSVIKVFTTLLQSFSRVILALTGNPLPSLGNALLDISASLGEFLTNMSNSAINGITNFTDRIVDLISKVKQLDSFKQLMSSIKDLFSNLFELVKNTIELLGSPFSAALSGITDFGSNGQSVLETLDSWFINLNNHVKSFNDTFGAFGKSTTETMGSFNTAIGGAYGKFFEDLNDHLAETGALGHPLKTFVETFKFFKDAVTQKVGSWSGSFLSEFGEWADSKAISFGNIRDKMRGIPEAFNDMFGRLKSVLQTIIDYFKTADGEIDVDKLVNLAKALLYFKVIASFANFFTSLTSINNSISTFFTGLSETFNFVERKTTFASFGEAIKDIGKGFILMGATIALIAAINTKKAMISLGAITVLLLAITGAYALVKKIDIKNKDSEKFGETALSFVGISASILILALALQKLSSIDTKSLWTGVGAIAAIMGMLSLLALAMHGLDKGSGKSLKDAARSIKSLASSLLIFAAAIGVFYLLKNEMGDSFASTIWTVIGIITSIVIAVSVINAVSKNAGKAANSILALAAAIVLLTIPIKVFSKMDSGELAYGLGGLGAALLILVGYIAAICAIAARIGAFREHLIKVSKSLIELAKAMTLFMIPVAIMAKLGSKDQLAEGIGGFVAILVGMLAYVTSLALIAKHIKSAAKDIDSITKSLMNLAKAFILFMVPLIALSLMLKNENNQVTKALGIMATILLGIIVFLSVSAYCVKEVNKYGDNMTKIANAMLKVSASFVIIAVALKLVDTVKDKWQSLSTVSIAFIAIATAMSYMAKHVGKLDLNAIAIGIGILSASLIAIALAFKIVESITFDNNMVTGVIALGAAILTLAIACKILGSAKASTLTGAAALIVLAGAMIVIAGAISMLAKYNFKQLATSLITLVVAVYALVGAIAILGSLQVTSLLGAAAFAILAASTLAIAYSFKILVESIHLLGPALSSLGDGIVAFVDKIASLTDKTDKFKEGLLGIADAIISTLIFAIEKLWPYGMKLYVLGAALTPIIFSISVALGIAAVATYLVSKAIEIATEAIKNFIDYLSMSKEKIDIFAHNLTAFTDAVINSVNKLYPEAGKIFTVGLVLTQVILGLSIAGVALAAAAVAVSVGILALSLAFGAAAISGGIILALIYVFSLSIGELSARLIELKDQILESGDIIVKFSQSMYVALANLGQGLVTFGAGALIAGGALAILFMAMPTGLTAAVMLAQAIIILSSSISTFSTALAQTGPAFVIAATGMDVFTKSLTKLVTVITSIISVISTLGQYVAQGFANGITSGASSVVSAGSTLAGGLILTVMKMLGIASPSRVFWDIGNYVIKGLSNGLTDNQGEVTTASSGIVDGLINTFNGRLDEVKNSGAALGEAYTSSFNKSTEDKIAGLDLAGTFNGAVDSSSIDSFLNSVGISGADSLSNGLTSEISNMDLSGIITEGIGGEDLNAQIKELTEGIGLDFDTGLSDSILNNSSLIDGAMDGALDTSFSNIQNGIAERTSGINESMQTMIDSMHQINSKDLINFQRDGENIVNRFLMGVNQKKSAVDLAWTQMLSGSLTKIRETYSDFVGVGNYIITGFIAGINAKKAEALAAIKELADATANAARNALDINSPSKVFYEIGEYVGEGFVNGINDFIGQADVSGDNLATSVLSIGDEVKDSITESFTSMSINSDEITNMFDTLLNTMILAGQEKLTEFSTFGTDIITNVCLGMQETIPVEESLQTIFDYIFTNVKEYNSKFTDHGRETMVKFAAGVGQKKDAIMAVIESSLNAALSKVRGYYESFYQAGVYISEGIQKGIESKIAEIAEAAAEAVREAIDAARREADEHSPSKEFYKIGAYMGEGMVLGMNALDKDVARSGASMAMSAIKAATNIMEEAGDFEPVITPVLDLSRIEEGSSELSAMLSRDKALSINAAVNQNEANLRNASTVSSEQQPQQITFTQNNYSPKALSRYEIYRQTNTQLSSMKSMLSRYSLS